MLVMTHLFTPADGSPPREIKATIETQEDPKHPFLVTIDFGDGHKDRVPWLEPSFFGLELAARFFAQRVLDHVDLVGGGTLDPEVGRPLDYAPPARAFPAAAGSGSVFSAKGRAGIVRRAAS